MAELKPTHKLEIKLYAHEPVSKLAAIALHNELDFLLLQNMTESPLVTVEVDEMGRYRCSSGYEGDTECP